MAPHSSSSGKDSAIARVTGSACAGITELLIFHPVDTVAKRLMNNNTKISSTSEFNQVIFAKAAQRNTIQKYISLFPGLGFAAGYKILQRVYKFGGQPYVKDFLAKNYGTAYNNIFGERNGKTMLHASAGSLVGIGEIVLLPLDALKIKMQVNAQNYAGQSALSIIRSEGLGLYRGAGWTAARNAPGSFALFGGSAFTKEYLFALEDYSKATFLQNFVASIAGAVASITISAPLDVIKTRIQAQSQENAKSGVTIVKNMIVQEGLGSFFKGITPKILVVGPKLIFSFTVAQQLIPIIGNLVDGKK